MNEVKEETPRMVIIIMAPGTSLIEKYQHLKVNIKQSLKTTSINCNLSLTLSQQAFGPFDDIFTWFQNLVIFTY